ncbi:MAG: translation initiation factor IF-2 subunit alpha [Candidatus Micrarchaeia archaeon]
MSLKGEPELDEFVIATVKKIFPYGAFCTLDEYDGREAFLHVSEVAPRWIKNIHEFLKEDQKIVARILRIVPEKNQIDLSLKRVSEADRRRKIEDYRREKRAVKLFEIVESRIGKPHEEVWKGMGEELVEKFGNLYSAFEEIVRDKRCVDSLKAPEEWKRVLVEVVCDSIKIPQVKVSGTLNLTCREPDGVEVIKKALSEAKESGGKNAEIIYLGAPRYKLSVTALDYKKAEKVIDEMVEKVKECMKGKEGAVKFERDEV